MRTITLACVNVSLLMDKVGDIQLRVLLAFDQETKIR